MQIDEIRRPISGAREKVQSKDAVPIICVSETVVFPTSYELNQLGFYLGFFHESIY